MSWRVGHIEASRNLQSDWLCDGKILQQRPRLRIGKGEHFGTLLGRRIHGSLTVKRQFLKLARGTEEVDKAFKIGCHDVRIHTKDVVDIFNLLLRADTRHALTREINHMQMKRIKVLLNFLQGHFRWPHVKFVKVTFADIKQKRNPRKTVARTRSMTLPTMMHGTENILPAIVGRLNACTTRVHARFSSGSVGSMLTNFAQAWLRIWH